MPVVINGASGVILPPGSIDAPIIRSNDADTGFSFPAPGQLGVIVDGVNQATFSSSGVIFNSNVVLSGSSTFPSGFTSNGTTTFASGFTSNGNSTFANGFTSSGTTTFASGFVSSGTVVFASGLTSSGTSIFASGLTSTGTIALNNQSELRLADSDNSNYVGFKSAATVASNVIWTLPSGDGSSAQLLSTNGSGVLNWATPSTTAVNLSGGASGSIPYQSNTGTTTFLNPGTSGQVLTTQGANTVPAWVTPAGSPLVLISTITASNSATVTFDSGITSTYKNYKIIGNNIVVGQVGDVYYYFSVNGGVSYDAAGTEGRAARIHGGGFEVTSAVGAGALAFWPTAANSTSSRMSFEINLYSLPLSGTHKGGHSYCFNEGWANSVSQGFMQNLAYTQLRNTNPVNGIRFTCNGNFVSGTFALYGLKDT